MFDFRLGLQDIASYVHHGRCSSMLKGCSIQFFADLYVTIGLIIHISLQKLLGYFTHMFRLSQLHQCYQGMLPNRFS